jgi:hypothetical protein
MGVLLSCKYCFHAQSILTYIRNRAYPTPALALGTAFGWRAVLPTLYNGSVCCESQDTSSATPSHTIFATHTGSTNIIDPSGWLYTLINIDNINRISAVEISSLWGGQSIGFPYTGCPYVSCNLPATTVAGAVYASSVAYLFATTTITTSGPTSASPSPATSTSSEHTSAPLSAIASSAATPSEHTTVEVDPIAAKPTSLSAETTQASGGSPNAGSNPSTAGSTVVQPPPSALSSVQQDTTQPSASKETLQSQTRPAALPATSSGTPISQNGGEQSSRPGLSAGLSTQAPVSSPAQTPTQQPLSTFQSPSSEPVTPVVVEPTTPSTGQFVTSSLTLVLVSSATSGQVSSTTTFVFVTTPLKSTLQFGSSSVNSQASNAVVGTELPINSGAITISSAAALSQGTASSEQPVPGSSVKASGDYPITYAASSESVAAIVIGGSTIAPDASSQYIMSGQPLVPGSSITLVQGTSTAVIALPTGQSEVTPSLVATGITPNVAATRSALPIVVGSNTITPDASSNYVISGQTLTAGAEITLVSNSSTAVVALQTSNSQTYLVVGTSTSRLSEQTASEGTIPMPAFTIGSSVITPDSASEYVVASQTLRPGAAITVSGSVISLASHATEIVIGTSTQTAAYNQGFGGYIWSALGATSTTVETTASGGSAISSTVYPDSPGSKTNGVVSLTSRSSASNADSVLSPASGTSSVSGTDVISASSSGASQQGSSGTGGRVPSSSTSIPSNLGMQTTSTSNDAELRSVGVGLAILLCIVAFIFG